MSVTALQVLLEFQRDWARNEHYDEVMATLKAHCSIYGPGAEHAITSVRQGTGSLHSADSHYFESQ